MLIKLKPIDTLFFRDSRSFSKGDETWANGIFPPAPSVFYGAIRSVYFSHHIDKLEKANEPDDPTKNLIIKNIYFRIGECDFFPLPQDLVALKEEAKNNINKYAYPLIMQDISQYAHSGKTQVILTSNPDLKDTVESVKDGLIEKGNLQDYLFMGISSVEKFSYRKISEFVESEPKIGIERSNCSRSSEEGMLYRVGMNRLIDFSFVIEFDGLDLPEKGFMKIGGEGKVVFYEKIDNTISLKNPNFSNSKEDNEFKIYISTPAIFKHGWLPGWLDLNSLEGTIPGINCKIKLITASLTKPISIGGYDIKTNKPKPMRKAVGAGSVYYFWKLEGSMNEIVNVIHSKSISDQESDKKQGFGISYIGRV